MLNKLAASMVCDHTAEASPRLGNLCGCGGTGIHSGLKIRQMSYQHFEGSTPSTRTIGEQMPPRIPEFHATLAKIATLHEAKNQDYATDKDPFSNFVFTETAIELFRNNADKTFVWPIATKLARLSVLLSKTGLPNFESIEDSFDDIATYVILWKCDTMDLMRAVHGEAETQEQSELIKVRMELAKFIGTLTEVETNRLYEVVRKMKAQSQAAQGPQQYPAPTYETYNKIREQVENQTNEPSLGRLNYAGTDHEGKSAGFPHVSPAQRRAAESNQRDPRTPDRDR